MPLRDELWDTYHRCTARIEIADNPGGTGFFVAPGRLITCAHVIGVDGKPEELSLRYKNKPYGASVIKLIPPTPRGDETFPDIAILATDFIDHPCVYISTTKSIPRERLYTFGYTERKPLGESVTAMVDGFTVESTNETDRLIKFTRAQIIGGLSGAPLLSEKTGGVCGMVNRTFDSTNDLGGLAIPAERILGSLVDEGIQVQPWHDANPGQWLALLPRAKKVAAVVPSRVFAVPRTMNHFFVGRDALIERLRTQLDSVGRVGLVGLGGVGKTQAAVEYAYRYRDRYQNVLWAAADDADTLTKSFVAMAKALRLREANISDDNEILAAVRRWFEANQEWLLIVDNADAPAAIASFLPIGINGHVIVTSRRRDLASLNVERSLEVPPLNSEEAATFLLRRTDRSNERERADANQIAALLGNLPLALEQAGAHILASGTPLADYAENLRRGGLTALDTGAAPVDFRKTVATTWRYAFAAIESAPLARDLLCLSTFLNSDDIPLTLFEKSGKVASPAIAAAMNAQVPAIVVNQMLEPLVDYSLISRDVVRRSFGVHRLVQQAVHTRMSSQERATWTERAVELLLDALPEIRFSNWELNNRLLPHVQTVAGFVAQYGIASARAAAMLDHMGTYLFFRARLSDALPLLEQGLAMREKLFGMNDPAVAQSLTHVANVHRELGRYQLARPMYQRALAIRRRRRPRSADLASTLVNTAILSEDLGNYANAERLYREALAIQLALRPRDELRVAEVTNNLALLLDARTDFAQALKLHKRALAMRRIHEDEEPLEYAQSLNNLGRHYVEREMYGRAGPYFEQALRIYRKYLDPSHPDVIMVTYNSALIFDNENLNAKAEQLYLWAIDAWTKLFGDTYYDLVLAYNSLGVLYAKTGRHKEARTAYRRALAIITKIAGARHPNAAMIRENLHGLGSETPKRVASARRSSGPTRKGEKVRRPVRKAGGIRGRKSTARKAWRGGRRKSAVGRRGSPRRR